MHKSIILNSSQKKEYDSSSESEVSEKISKLDMQIYNTLVQSGPITRSALAKSTGIARSTLYDGLLRLSLKGLVKKYSDSDHNTRGRPKVYFEAVSK